MLQVSGCARDRQRQRQECDTHDVFAHTLSLRGTGSVGDSVGEGPRTSTPFLPVSLKVFAFVCVCLWARTRIYTCGCGKRAGRPQPRHRQRRCSRRNPTSCTTTHRCSQWPRSGRTHVRTPANAQHSTAQQHNSTAHQHSTTAHRDQACPQCGPAQPTHPPMHPCTHVDSFMYTHTCTHIRRICAAGRGVLDKHHVHESIIPCPHP